MFLINLLVMKLYLKFDLDRSRLLALALYSQQIFCINHIMCD